MRNRRLLAVVACAFLSLGVLTSLWLNGFVPYLAQQLPWTAYAWASLGVLADILTVLVLLAMVAALFFFARRVHHGSPT